MKPDTSEPQTLREAILFFADNEHCRAAVEPISWPDGLVSCPICGSGRVPYLATQRRYKCYGKHPRAHFSLKVGTIGRRQLLLPGGRSNCRRSHGL